MNKLMSVDILFSSAESGTVKPVESIISILAAFDSDCSNMVAKKSQVIEYVSNENHYCYFLLKGSMALHRRGDGLVMTSESAPFIFGLSNQLGPDNGMYLRVLEDATFKKVSLPIVNQIIEKYDLWKSLTQLLVYTTSRVYEHCARAQQMSAYDIIRLQLNELMHETDELRLNTAASSYIKSRTYLSRSGIMRILSELRSGGYIVMEKGVLKSITFLPKKY